MVLSLIDVIQLTIHSLCLGGVSIGVGVGVWVVLVLGVIRVRAIDQSQWCGRNIWP